MVNELRLENSIFRAITYYEDNMVIREINASSILNKSGIPGISWAINPYGGCLHSCVYCYASFMKRFSGHTEPWGKYLDVKVNAPELLEKALKKKKIDGPVLMSSVTDAYQYAEAKYKITRRIVEILQAQDAPLEILTKSDLVTRDIDLFKKFSDITVGLSIMSVDDKMGRRFEPLAPLPSKRLKALRMLKENSINTYVFISPFIPGISNIDDIMNSITGLADEAAIEAFNMRGACLAGVKSVLNYHYPGIAPGWEFQASDSRYWDFIEAKGRKLAKASGIRFAGCYRH